MSIIFRVELTKNITLHRARLEVRDAAVGRECCQGSKPGQGVPFQWQPISAERLVFSPHAVTRLAATRARTARLTGGGACKRCELGEVVIMLSRNDYELKSIFHHQQ